MPFSRFAPAAAALLIALCAGSARGQTLTPDAGSGIEPAIEQQVRALALAGAEAGVRAVEPAPGEVVVKAPRVEILIGQLDPRLRLAPCQLVQPYLPDGTRLWGKSHIGLRCLRGAVKWNVYLPVTVKAFGTALVATNGAPSGTLLSAADFTPAEVDLAEDPSAAVSRPELAVGHMLARTLKPGQSLRLSHLKAKQWFAAGDTVMVSAQGEGFSVAGEGQALNNGVEGQPVRVRTDNGHIVSGLPVGDRRVVVGL